VSLNNARIALYTHISENFSAAQIVFKDDNDRAMAMDKGVNPWIYVYIAWGDEVQMSMPAPNARFCQIGVLAAKLYVRVEDGEGVLDQITDTYKSNIRARQLGNITLSEMKIGPSDSNDKWQVRHLYANIKVFNSYSIISA
jgi:hypothetical protein